MAGSHVTGAFSQLISKDYDRIAYDEYMRQPEEFTKIANISNENSAYIKEGQVYPLGAHQSLSEGEAIGFDSLEQGNDKIVYFNKYGLGIQITEEMYDDDQSGIMKKLFSELGKSAAYTRDLSFFDILNNAFATTYYTGFDGKALCDDSHSLGTTGETLDNDGAVSLSTSGLEAGMNHFENMRNDKNIPVVSKGPYLLVIPYGLKWKAEELLLSPYNPDNANDQYNSLGNENISYMIGHYLTDSNNWFLIDKGMHDLRFIWRKKFAVKRKDDFNTDTMLAKGTMRYRVAFFDWRGVYGAEVS